MQPNGWRRLRSSHRGPPLVITIFVGLKEGSFSALRALDGEVEIAAHRTGVDSDSGLR